MLEFRILGPLEVVDESGPMRLGGLKQRATLAILLLCANRVVSVERLADDLYAGAAPVTAVTQVQRQISELRKALGPDCGIETRAPGYLIRLSSEQLDLGRFERRVEEARHALEREEVGRAVDLLHEALALWRGNPLADLQGESFAQLAIPRFEEIRLAAVVQRLEAELRLGRHRELVAELEGLVAAYPLREPLRALLMLALYRSGRQADSLGAFRSGRQLLVDEFGIEPGSALRALEHAILNHATELDLAPVPPPDDVPSRAVLVLPSDEEQLEGLLTIAEPLATSPGRELIVARLLAGERELGPAVASLNARRDALSVNARTAAFTTLALCDDAVRLATANDVDLVLVDARLDGGFDRLPDDFAAILDRSPADVGILVGAPVDLRQGVGVFVPFGGGEHEWAALELAAWLASGTQLGLRLVGTKADPRRGRRDASRLLADASSADRADRGRARGGCRGRVSDGRGSARALAGRRNRGYATSACPRRTPPDAPRPSRSAAWWACATREPHALQLVDRVVAGLNVRGRIAASRTR